MTRYRLTIKGTPAQARAKVIGMLTDGNAHIEVAAVGKDNTYLDVCTDDQRSLVMWFCNEPRPPAGQPYPVGTLLLYTENPLSV